MSRLISLRMTRVLGALTAAILIAAPGLVAQQGGTVTGRVLDTQTGLPLGAVQVFIPSLDLGGLTQQNGRYLLQNIPAGTHDVNVARIGYRTVAEQVTVGGGQVVERNFTLTEEALALDEIIVTGTAGGTRRRALGNAVDRLDTGVLQEQIALPTMQSALTGRVPGLQFQRRAGTVGAGSRIRIRGMGSFALSSNPLIYVDGVRVNNQSRAGPPIGQTFGSSFSDDDLGRGNTNVLDDLNMEEVESIEIIKGPAAATLYGTEASAGVIQIITKRGALGAPQFDVAVSTGANFMMNPAEKYGTNFTCASAAAPPCPAGDLVPYNMYDISNKYISGEILGADGERIFEWPTERLYRNGRIGTYDLSVRGGTAAVRYYLSGNFSEAEGIEWYNRDEKTRVRANLNILLAENLTFDINGSYIDGFTRYGDPVSGEGGAFRNTKDPIWQCVVGLNQLGARDCPRTAGYYEQTPGDAAVVETTRDYARFLGGMTLNHNVGEWLTQRVVFGIDKGWDVNNRYFPRDEAPVYRETREGTVDYERPITTNSSFEYTANFTYEPNETWGLQTSFGAQYFSRSYERVQVIGTDFASDLSQTVNQVPVEKAIINFDDITNRSLGVFVQEQIGWNDRLFVTAAVRFDDNSAFGSDFDAQTYPKFSGTWVASEEAFWNVDFVNSFRLRGAWGRAGRQPDTFAGTNIYGVIPAPGGKAGIIPVQPGNLDVGPEVSTELELGFDVAVLDDRVSAEFTYFDQENKGALLSRRLAPSVGFPGSVQQNLGRIDNWGWEAVLNSRLYESASFSFDLLLNASHTDNEIKELGDVATGRQIKLGYPWPNETTNYTVASAELLPTGGVDRASVMCDSGVRTGPADAPDASRGYLRGGAAVPCQGLGRLELLIGRRFHPYTFTVNPTVSLFQNSLQIFALAQGKHGGWAEDANSPWQGNFSGVRKYWENDDPVYLAGRINSGPFRDHLVDEAYEGDFWKLRELGVRYALPASLVTKSGADRASLVFSGRDIWTIWRKHETVGGVAIADPEASGFGPDGGGFYYITPPTSSVHLTLRVSF